ncbi:hypothetical protein AQB9606_03268 [Aquabacterium sp. CECT 9606]|nr:hypothetical protein AQB9606_03268 [Aquabacterium sp. CECT 9606]
MFTSPLIDSADMTLAEPYAQAPPQSLDRPPPISPKSHCLA